MQLKLCEYKSEKLTLECVFNAFRYSAFMQMHSAQMCFIEPQIIIMAKLSISIFTKFMCVISIIPLSLQFVRKYKLSVEGVVYYIICISQPTQRRSVSRFLMWFFFFETMKIFLERPLMRTKQVEKQVKYL